MDGNYFCMCYGGCFHLEGIVMAEYKFIDGDGKEFSGEIWEFGYCDHWLRDLRDRPIVSEEILEENRRRLGQIADEK